MKMAVSSVKPGGAPGNVATSSSQGLRAGNFTPGGGAEPGTAAMQNMS